MFHDGGGNCFQKFPDVALKHFVASSYGEGVLYHLNLTWGVQAIPLCPVIIGQMWSESVRASGFFRFRAGAAYTLSHILALEFHAKSTRKPTPT